MSQGNKYHLQAANDLQTLVSPPVQSDAASQRVSLLAARRGRCGGTAAAQ